MKLILGILGVALTVAIALIVILSIGPVRRAVGLGQVTPTGIPASVSGVTSPA